MEARSTSSCKKKKKKERDWGKAGETGIKPRWSWLEKQILTPDLWGGDVVMRYRLVLLFVCLLL